MSPRDAGKLCTDESQCKQHCVAETPDDVTGICIGFLDAGYEFFEMRDGIAVETHRMD